MTPSKNNTKTIDKPHKTTYNLTTISHGLIPEEIPEE